MSQLKCVRIAPLVSVLALHTEVLESGVVMHCSPPRLAPGFHYSEPDTPLLATRAVGIIWIYHSRLLAVIHVAS